jgi:hypothetical protein
MARAIDADAEKRREIRQMTDARFGHEFLLDERMIRTFDSLNIPYLWVEGHQGVTLPGALALDVCDKGLQKTKEDSTLEILEILNTSEKIQGDICIRSRQNLTKVVES